MLKIAQWICRFKIAKYDGLKIAAYVGLQIE